MSISGVVVYTTKATRYVLDASGQVGWDIAYNFSHFAIYLPKLIKMHGNVTKL